MALKSPGDVAVTTDVVSVSYTDFTVSPSTDFSTAAQAVTVPSQVSQTQTETIYSPTVFKATTTTALTGGSFATSPMRRRNENRGGCIPTQSRTPSLSLSSTSASSLSSSSTSALFPITSNRSSHEDYSSVCACITVVATTQSVVLFVATSTSMVDTTVGFAVLSTSLSSITSVWRARTVADTVTLVSGGPCVASPVCAPRLQHTTMRAGEFSYIWGTGILSPSYSITDCFKPLDSSLINVTLYPDNVHPSGLPVIYSYSDPNEGQKVY